MKKLYLFLSLASLLTLSACGNNSNSFKPSGSFTLASVNGQYTYQLTGFDLGNGGASFSEAGVFTVDGKGNITAGTDDFAEGGSGDSTATFTGTYSIGNDGTGFLNFNFSSGTAQFAFTVISSSKLYLSESDGSANAYGAAEIQTSSALASVPSGNFAFRIHSSGNLQGSLARIGGFALSGGVVTGNEDIWPNASSNPIVLGGSFNTPTSNGRGTGTFTDSTGTLSFVYYVVNSGNIRFIVSTPGVIGVGRAESQSGSFTTASLSGSFAFGSRGDTVSTGLGGIQRVGRFTADGSGGISAGVEDFVQDGTSAPNDSFTGAYTVTSNGRVVVNLSSNAAGSLLETFWLVSGSRAFFLVNDPNLVEDGTIDAQQSSAFSASTITGQFAFVMDGFTNVLLDRVGTLQWDGNKNLTLNEVVVNQGAASNAVLSGNYVVSSNGRTVATVNSLSNNLVFYFFSGTDGYVLQNDPGVEVGGALSKQQ